MKIATATPQHSRRKLILIIMNAILLPVVAYSGYVALSNNAKAATSCLTTTQIQADSRCLYVMNGKVYNKGSKSSPHHGHPCGMNVSSIIPSSHTGDIAFYLDPNLIGSVCAQETQPTPTATRTPTPSRMPTPSRTPTPQTTQQPQTTNIPPATPTPTIDPNGIPPDNQNTTQPTDTPSPAATDSPQYQQVIVYLPPPTQQVIYVTATPGPNGTNNVQATLYPKPSSVTVNGTPPGGMNWKILAIPAGLLMVGLLL